MASPIDVIKEYMVSLGFQVDKSSYDQATKAIDSAGESLAKLAGSTVKNFAEAGVAVAGFFAAAIAGIAKFINGLGNAQIQYEMLSRQMWTTQENAEAFSTTLKAMGRNLNDLYLSPTLMQQFEVLNRQAFEMMPPAEYQQQMKFVQSISFEFTRMKLEGTYALQWIGYYFIKYMAGPLSQIQMTLHGINDTIIKTMPYWTKVVAEVMAGFAKFGIAVVEGIKAVDQEFFKVGKSIPTNIKLIGLALGALAIIMEQGPIGWIIDAIVALGLALDDFFTYLHGGQSEFGPFWKKLIDLYNYLKDPVAINIFKNAMKVAFNVISFAIDEIIQGVKRFYDDLVKDGYFSNLKKNFQLTFDIIQKLVDGAISWFSSFWSTLNQSGIIKDLVDDFAKFMTATMNASNAVLGLINKILGLKGTQNVLKSVGDWLTNFILRTLQTIDKVIQKATTSFNLIADLLQGKWSKAMKDAQGLFDAGGSNPAAKQSYMYPSSSNKTTNNSSHVSMTNNFTITGSDPNATANATTNNLTTLMRTQKGIIA